MDLQNINLSISVIEKDAGLNDLVIKNLKRIKVAEINIIIMKILQEELYHSGKEFDAVGMMQFCLHILGYFKGDRIVPLTIAPNKISGGDFYFAFTNDLLKEILLFPDKYKKTYEVAVKYGFNGYSSGGRNGIFYQRKQDKKLLEATDFLANKAVLEIFDYLETMPEDHSKLAKIKIVCHEPDGTRMVGVFNESLQRAIFLGFAKY